MLLPHIFRFLGIDNPMCWSHAVWLLAVAKQQEIKHIFYSNITSCISDNSNRKYRIIIFLTAYIGLKCLSVFLFDRIMNIFEIYKDQYDVFCQQLTKFDLLPYTAIFVNILLKKYNKVLCQIWFHLLWGFFLYTMRKMSSMILP